MYLNSYAKLSFLIPAIWPKKYCKFENKNVIKENKKRLKGKRNKTKQMTLFVCVDHLFFPSFLSLLYLPSFLSSPFSFFFSFSSSSSSLYSSPRDKQLRDPKAHREAQNYESRQEWAISFSFHAPDQLGRAAAGQHVHMPHAQTQIGKIASEAGDSQGARGACLATRPGGSPVLLLTGRRIPRRRPNTGGERRRRNKESFLKNGPTAKSGHAAELCSFSV
jgi:hypothetical protein